MSTSCFNNQHARTEPATSNARNVSTAKFITSSARTHASHVCTFHTKRGSHGFVRWSCRLKIAVAGRRLGMMRCGNLERRRPKARQLRCPKSLARLLWRAHAWINTVWHSLLKVAVCVQLVRLTSTTPRHHSRTTNIDLLADHRQTFVVLPQKKDANSQTQANAISCPKLY